MKHLFIVNPKAGKGKGVDIVPEIHKIFEEVNEEFLIEITEKPGHATEIVKNYVNKENYRVYAVGGDGTLNEVLNGMAGSDSSLGVIPRGSGNDFIRSVYEKSDVKDILKRTVLGKDKEIDMVRINNRYFINISSVGIDAEVVYNARKLKNLPFITGGLAYVLSIFLTVFKFKYKNIKLKIDGEEIKSKITLMALANGTYYGGGMKVSPFSNVEDGILNVCMVNELSKIKILTLFPKLMRGEHEEIKEVSFHKGRDITLTSEEEITLNIDGEIIKSKEILCNVIPKGIKFIIPEM